MKKIIILLVFAITASSVLSAQRVEGNTEDAAFMDPGWYMKVDISPLSYTIRKSYGPEAETWLNYVNSDLLNLDNFGLYSNKLSTEQAFEENYKYYNLANRIMITNGYYVSDIFQFGINTGYELLYHGPYVDAAIHNFMVGVDLRLVFVKSKVAPYVNVSGGKNLVYNPGDRLYQTEGKFYGNMGMGLQFYIPRLGFLFFETGFEYSSFNFEEYYFEDVTFMLLNTKIGLLF